MSSAPLRVWSMCVCVCLCVFAAQRPSLCLFWIRRRKVSFSFTCLTLDRVPYIECVSRGIDLSSERFHRNQTVPIFRISFRSFAHQNQKWIINFDLFMCLRIRPSNVSIPMRMPMTMGEKMEMHANRGACFGHLLAEKRVRHITGYCCGRLYCWWNVRNMDGRWLSASVDDWCRQIAAQSIDENGYFYFTRFNALTQWLLNNNNNNNKWVDICSVSDW